MSYQKPPYYFTAYGLAVKHGFQGTEQEWLASLQGSKILDVVISGNDAEGHTANKTLVDILNANSSGMVRCIFDNSYLQLSYIDGDHAVFTGATAGDRNRIVHIDGHGAVHVGEQIPEESLFYVNMTHVMGSTYTVDKSSAEVLEAYKAGNRLIQCRITVEGMEYILPLCNATEASLIYAGAVLGTVVTVLHTDAGAMVFTRSDVQSFVITLSAADDGYTADKTAEEIKAAYEGGRELVCVLPVEDGVARLPLVHVTNDDNRMTCIFGGTAAWMAASDDVSTVSVSIITEPDGMVVDVKTDQLSGDGDVQVFNVRITGDESGEYSADRSSAEVIEAYKAGQVVQCYLNIPGNDGIHLFVDHIIEKSGIVVYCSAIDRYQWWILHYPDDHPDYYIEVSTNRYPTEEEMRQAIDDAGGEEPLVVEVALTDGVYSLVDSTYAELLAAVEENRDVRLCFRASANQTTFYCLTHRRIRNGVGELVFSMNHSNSIEYIIVSEDNTVARDQGYVVPTSRKINGKKLSSDVTLTAADVGALPSSTTIPSKTSQLTNDSGFLTSAPVTSVNGKTGAVTLTIPTVPSTLPNPKKLTLTGAVSASYDGSAAVSVEIPKQETVPDYVKAEAERLAEVVQRRQNANTITFLVCSDIHYYSPDNVTAHANAEKMQEAVVSMGQAMGLIRERVHIDFAAMLGDMTWDYGETHDEILAEMRFVNACLHKGFVGIPQFRMEGNHDEAYESGGNLTAGEIFSNIGAWNSGAVYGSRAAGYCYRDFDTVKLRVICLNSSESGGSSAQYSPEQVSWLASALQVETGWRSIILSHHPLDWGRSGGVDPTSTITSASGLIASFHGHIHNFLTGTVTNTDLIRIGIPNAGYSRENQYGESYGVNWKEGTTYSKTPGTAENTSFCVITIDTAEKKIYADHYGAGYSRVIPYDDAVLATYTVTNTLSNVTSSNSLSTVTEGAAYSATLSAPDGYVIEAVTVTMGGSDITATAYANGKITIGNVTGNIVITATAGEQPQVGYTNLVSTLEATDSTQPYNGIGYKNGCYASGSGEGTDAECVLTGLLPYDYAGGVRTPIYIKGCTLDTSKSHVRIICFRSAKTACFQSASGSSISTYFNVETLGTNYYKVTPLETISSQSGEVAYLRFSLVGTGENLIITLNEPIE